MAKQKHLRQSQVSAAVKGTAQTTDDAPAGQSDMTLVTVIVKRDGKEVPIERAFHNAVLATISSGMATADKLETTWKDNADAIIGDFFAAVPNGTKADIMKFFRESDEIDVMYQVFQQRHPKFGQASTWLEESKAGGSEGEKSKAAYNAVIRTIRATAMNQAVKVCGYYAESHKLDKTAETREQEDARSLIEGVIHDWANRVTLGRGKFKEADEKALLNSGIDALRKVLADNTAAKAHALAESNKTSTLNLSKPVGRAAQAAAQKAGEVAILDPADYEAAE